MHNGEWLEQKMKAQGFGIDETAEKLGVSRTTVWRWLANENMPKKKMKLIADVIGIDLRNELEGFDSFYDKPSESSDYKAKYIDLLEENRKLHQILRDYEEKYGNSPGQKRDRDEEK